MGSAVNHDVWPRLSNFHAEKTCFFFGKKYLRVFTSFSVLPWWVVAVSETGQRKVSWLVSWKRRFGADKMVCFLASEKQWSKYFSGLNGQWLPPLIKQDILWCIVLVSLDMFWVLICLDICCSRPWDIAKFHAWDVCIESWPCYMRHPSIGQLWICEPPTFDSKDSPQNMGSVSNHRCYYRSYGWR